MTRTGHACGLEDGDVRVPPPRPPVHRSGTAVPSSFAAAIFADVNTERLPQRTMSKLQSFPRIRDPPEPPPSSGHVTIGSTIAVADVRDRTEESTEPWRFIKPACMRSAPHPCTQIQAPRGPPECPPLSPSKPVAPRLEEDVDHRLDSYLQDCAHSAHASSLEGAGMLPDTASPRPDAATLQSPSAGCSRPLTCPGSGRLASIDACTEEALQRGSESLLRDCSMRPDLAVLIWDPYDHLEDATDVEASFDPQATRWRLDQSWILTTCGSSHGSFGTYFSARAPSLASETLTAAASFVSDAPGELAPVWEGGERDTALRASKMARRATGSRHTALSSALDDKMSGCGDAPDQDDAMSGFEDALGQEIVLDQEGSTSQPLAIHDSASLEANLTMSHADIVSRSLTPFARGSSALVFEARVRLSPGQEPEWVVLKERRQRSTEEDDERERRVFEDELRLSSKLPGVHGAFVFCHGGCISPPGAMPTQPDFIVFERCDACVSLYIDDRYRAGCAVPLWLREVLDLGIAILHALSYIHPRGTTHGDVSSGNVLVKRNVLPGGRAAYMSAVLTDFETARVRRRECEHGATVQARCARGTPGFMPPLYAEEAALASTEPYAVDRMHTMRDIYSAAMVTFHAMTGCRPFDTPMGITTHAQVSELARRNCRVYGTVLPLPPGLPPALVSFFERCWALQGEEDVDFWLLARQRRRELVQLRASLAADELNRPLLSADVLHAFEAQYADACAADPPSRQGSADVPEARNSNSRSPVARCEDDTGPALNGESVNASTLQHDSPSVEQPAPLPSFAPVVPTGCGADGATKRQPSTSAPFGAAMAGIASLELSSSHTASSSGHGPGGSTHSIAQSPSLARSSIGSIFAALAKPGPQQPVQAEVPSAEFFSL